MGRLLAALLISMVALALFSALSYGAPPLAALGSIAGCLIMLAVWLGHLWARSRLEARK